MARVEKSGICASAGLTDESSVVKIVAKSRADSLSGSNQPLWGRHADGVVGVERVLILGRSRGRNSRAYGMTAALQYGGLVPGKDVDVIYIGNSNDRLAALRTDRVQATVLSPPLTRVARQDGYHRLALVSDILRDWVGNGYFTGKGLVRQNPGLVERFLRASFKGVRFLKSDRKKALEIAMRNWKAPESEAAEYYDEIIPNFEDWGEINTKGISRAITQISKQRNQTPLPMQEFLDMRFVNAMKQATK